MVVVGQWVVCGGGGRGGLDVVQANGRQGQVTRQDKARQGKVRQVGPWEAFHTVPVVVRTQQASQSA